MRISSCPVSMRLSTHPPARQEDEPRYSGGRYQLQYERHAQGRGDRDHGEGILEARVAGSRPDARRTPFESDSSMSTRLKPTAVEGRFTRWVLPGLGVKAVVIGGGYATGRELAGSFSARSLGRGLYAILFATLLFSIFCSLTLCALPVRARPSPAAWFPSPPSARSPTPRDRP